MQKRSSRELRRRRGHAPSSPRPTSHTLAAMPKKRKASSDGLSDGLLCRVLRHGQEADLEKLAAAAPKPDPPESRESLKWLPHGGAAKPPSKSVPGSFIRVNFKNQGKEPVKLTWIDYGGGEEILRRNCLRGG